MAMSPKRGTLAFHVAGFQGTGGGRVSLGMFRSVQSGQDAFPSMHVLRESSDRPCVHGPTHRPGMCGHGVPRPGDDPVIFR